jgi:hypothetical protein
MAPRVSVLVALAAAAAAAAAAAGPRSAPGVDGLTRAELHPRDAHPRTRAAHARMMSRWRRSPPAGGAGRSVLKPADFGADPSCGSDSSPAFAAITAALGGLVVGNMSDGIKDLGGAVVDLDGGCYLLSSPFLIPQFFGNVHVQSGELRAAPAFAGAALLQVGAASCTTPSGQGSCNENVGLHALTLDGSHVAPSCVAIEATMGATLDSSSAVFGFTSSGVLLQGGHESMVEETWVAAYFWSDPKKERNDAVGILVNGNDHFLTNVIVFSARDGVVVNGAADLLTNVHTWNSATGNGGRGIVTSVSQNRFVGVYLDYTDMVVIGNGAQQLVVEGSYFLGGAQIVFEARKGNTEVSGVALIGNAWAYSGAPYAVNETAAAWTAVHDLVISGTASWAGAPEVAAAATQVLPLPASGASQTLDFSSQLLFPSVPVDPASVAVQVLVAGVSKSEAPINVVAGAAGQSVTVYNAGQTDARYSVRVTVDQSSYSTTKKM